MSDGDYARELEWSDLLKVGDEQLDAEHERFISSVNALNLLISTTKDRHVIGRMLTVMLREVVEHFAHEEEHLAAVEYPETLLHARKHARITAMIIDKLSDLTETDFNIRWGLTASNIKEVLVEHFLHDDARYREFMLEVKAGE